MQNVILRRFGSAIKSHYETLGLPSTASKEEIKKAYFDLSKKLHPDMAKTGDEVRFKQVSEAYQVLSNERKRRDHDFEVRRSGGHRKGRFGEKLDEEEFYPPTMRQEYESGLRMEQWKREQEWIRMRKYQGPFYRQDFNKRGDNEMPWGSVDDAKYKEFQSWFKFKAKPKGDPYGRPANSDFGMFFREHLIKFLNRFLTLFFLLLIIEFIFRPSESEGDKIDRYYEQLKKIDKGK